MFLRTENGIFEIKKQEKGGVFIVKDKNNPKKELEIVRSNCKIFKVGSFLQYLCDGFYIMPTSKCFIRDYLFDGCDYQMFWFKLRQNKECKGYGFILTDDGMSFVTEMSLEKGELKLI